MPDKERLQGETIDLTEKCFTPNINNKDVATLNKKLKHSMKELQEQKVENKRNKDELTKYKCENKMNKEELYKYKKYYLDRSETYDWMMLDLTNLEHLLTSYFSCFPTNTVERDILQRVKRMLSESMTVCIT